MKAILISISLFIFSITLIFANPPENGNRKMNIFPNPAKDYIHLNIKDVNEIDHVRIYDKAGNLIKILTSVSQENTVDLSTYSAGRYLMVVFSKDGIYKEAFEISHKK